MSGRRSMSPSGDVQAHRRDLLLLAVGALGVSTSGPLIAATAVPALGVAFWRNAMALAFVAPPAVLTWRRQADRSGWVRRAPGGRGGARRAVVGAVFAGLALAVHFALWVPSLRLTSVASSTALVSLQAVWTALLARASGQAVTGRGWAGIGVALAGVAMITGVDVAVTPAALTGDALALAGGLFAAVYVVTGARVRRVMSTATYTTVCYGTAAATLGIVCLSAGVPLSGYDGRDWARLVALTLAAQLGGHTAFSLVLRRMPATVVSLATLLEVPGAALIAAVALGQLPSVGLLAGLLLLLAGLGLVVTARADTPPAPPAL